MTKPEVIASHVESLLKSWLDTDEVTRSDDDTWRMRTERGAYAVRIHSQHMPHVEIWAVALEHIEPDLPAWSIINDLNQNASHVRWFMVDDALVLSGELLGTTLDYDELACACSEVVSALDKRVPELAERLGGTLPHDWAEDEAAAEPSATGMYL